MFASHLKVLLAAGMMAPAISLASNPFMPSSAPSESVVQMEHRLRALEERAAEAETLLRDLTMQNLPGVSGQMLNEANASIALDPSAEVIGMINGKCLIKRGGANSTKLEKIEANDSCENLVPAAPAQ